MPEVAGWMTEGPDSVTHTDLRMHEYKVVIVRIFCGPSQGQQSKVKPFGQKVPVLVALKLVDLATANNQASD